MKRTHLLLALSALLVLGLLPAVGAEEGDGEEGTDHYPTEWVELGREQGEGTFGDDPEVGALGTALGADLKNGSMRMLDAETLELRIETHNLPATGGTPEAIRYTWDFQVVDVEGARQLAQIDGKWMNYSRGACDPTSGQCNPPEAMPRDPGTQPFLFRAGHAEACLGTDATGDCTGLTFNSFDELAVLQGVFDVDEATIAIAVPLALFNEIEGVELGHCSQIHPGAGLFGGMIESMPSAFISTNAGPSDTVSPQAGSQGGGVYTLPAPEGFTSCEDFLAADEDVA
jgi:hypothetical protein